MKNFVLIFTVLISGLSEAQVKSVNSGPGMYTGKQVETNSTAVPEELKGVGITEKLGQTIDLDLKVTDESGEVKTLRSYFSAHKPVMLSPVYFSCPGLCNFHFNGVTETLKKIDWNPGEKFEVIAFSFDSREKADLGLKKKATYMELYARPGTEKGFHFLTADEETIKKITGSIGFNFRWNETAKEWSHASAAVVMTPDGKISRYLHGIDFDPKDVKLALNEASNGKIGNIIDNAILFCFKYDEHKSRYGLQVFRVVQLGGLLTILLLALWLLPVLFKAGREKT